MMAILKTCCCWKSVREGSFACGIYTMIYYTLFTTFGTLHLTPAIENKVLFVLGLLALCVSGMCVWSSVLLLVGLCADNINFLIPWLICVSISTLMDVILCVYFTAKDLNLEKFSIEMLEGSLNIIWKAASNSSERLHSILFVTDFFFSALNVYCLLCVLSQYQEYSAGRGRPEDYVRMQVLSRLPDNEERVPTESGGGILLTVPEPSIEPANKLLQSPGLINSCAITTCIVEICHNESLSENNASVLSTE